MSKVIDIQCLKQWLDGGSDCPPDDTKVTLNRGQLRYLCGAEDVAEDVLAEPIQVELED